MSFSPSPEEKHADLSFERSSPSRTITDPKGQVQIENYNPKEDRFMHNQTEHKIRKTGRTIYSSTSSVYAEHTISDPNDDQVLYCIAAVLQAQMFDDYHSLGLPSPAYRLFNVEIFLPPEYGGDREEIPIEILNHETLNDNELRELLLAKALPTVDTIYRFFKFLMVLTEYSVECNILALVYINRITVKNNIAIRMENWRGLWLGAIILAQKVWDDKPLKTSSFCSVLTNLSKQQLIAMETKVFELLEYSATVRPSVYAKYFFELHELFLEITGGNSTAHRWTLQPLTVAEKKKLELRSNRHGRNNQQPHHYRSLKGNVKAEAAVPSSSSSCNSTSQVASSSATAMEMTPQKATPRPHKENVNKMFEDLQLSPRAQTYEDVTRANFSRYVIN